MILEDERVICLKLTEERIGELLKTAEQWKREGEKWIVRKYRFPSFLKAVEFVQRVAAVAEAHNHHPMIVIEYKAVTLRLSTWSEGGLTETDFVCARAFDETFKAMKEA